MGERNGYDEVVSALSYNSNDTSSKPTDIKLFHFYP